MQTLVVYFSKKGFTLRTIKMLEENLQQPLETLSITEWTPDTDLDSYDRIIIGSAVYNNQLSQKVLNFCHKKKDLLKSKNLGFFVTSLSDIETAKDYLFQSFPKELLRSTRCKAFFGGEIIWEKLNVLEKATLRMSKGITTDVSNINLSEIEKFAACLKKQH